MTSLSQSSRLARIAQPEDKAHSDWLARIVKRTETIKVGMTRRDVENVLVEDVGGFAQSEAMRYQHPACSCIKLDLEFELAVSGDRKDDKIVKRRTCRCSTWSRTRPGGEYSFTSPVTFSVKSVVEGVE